ncbi:MAG: flagellar basal body rod protein FlgC [Dehalococcoidia bacterium]|jgi:flagellar basal-body rod protein FlgC|uniref:flagellar basal body rod protein FlgC n=1 Tax=Candidatus Amarobacter glycogenicus TaxID=3140699 RepID=UPI001E0EAC68|nr:flagellar basal body rod protein FlgC [Dehalococcoidia bacterium]MBK6560663.1 flagellar basal body rod protein FlgC [Dehalococcoidia bacterium]MBK7124895.1 flagellar basal body rod protein FlgC [Dehalococcoidia bacterium]MBK7723906.1 flagellar basal body rod protein FlgC [Dehalococcoidia bacterium]MBK8559841.1 flagellar basal body rod protein FlgC [Dehalococcoidia bacterium]
MGLIRSIANTASGLSAQRVRMDTVSSNVANLETTNTPEGGPYQRKVVRFSSGDPSMPFANVVRKFMGGGSTGVVLTQVGVDTETPNRIVNDPSHPDADPETGLLEMPNVDLVQEMTDLTSANRSYQANVTVLNAVKQMALRALDITSR